MLATFHNHSTYSDGRAPVEGLYRAALDQGVAILGISDHLCIYSDGSQPKWSMRAHRLEEYRAEIVSFQGKGPVEVRIGLEIDWLGPEQKQILQRVERLDLDYRIGSVHHVGAIQVDSDRAAWERRTPEERDEILRRYWDNVRTMAESGFFDIAAHLDIPKRAGYVPTGDITAQIASALDALAAHGVVVELNTSGYDRPCADAFPSLEILRACRSRDIAVTLSADAHGPEQILRHFHRGLASLQAAGFERIARFRGREKSFEDLAGALDRRA